MTTRRTVEKKANKHGVLFALVSDGVTYEVWKLCENYSAHHKGGLSRTWRYVQKGLDQVAARALFAHRVSGSARV